ncbi:hypothetical protein ACLMMR_42020, partial [Streptomyces sp. NPDC000405]
NRPSGSTRGLRATPGTHNTILPLQAPASCVWLPGVRTLALKTPDDLDAARELISEHAPA